MTTTGQMELFEADTGWFHIFRSMIDSGDCAKLGPYAMVVYLVIKAHANLKTGLSFPSVATIARLAGIREKQVKRSLVTLTEMHYLMKRRGKRGNIYALKERIAVMEGESAVAMVTADYIPLQMRAIQERIQQMLQNREIARGQTIHVNLTVQVIANTVQINGANGLQIITSSTKT